MGCDEGLGRGSPGSTKASLQPPSSRATSNARVRETVALELSDVNSSLQLLKEELAGLDSSGDTGQPERCVCECVQGRGLAPGACVCASVFGDMDWPQRRVCM